MMRTLLWTCALALFLSTSIVAQDLEQLRKIISDNTPATLPDDLGRRAPSQELVDACKAVANAANQIYTLPSLDEADRYWALQREAIALIVLAYVDTPAHFPRLAVVSEELGKRGNQNLFRETEKHVLRIGRALAVSTRPVGDVGIDFQVLAERMVAYAEQYPGRESMQIIDDFLRTVRTMNATPRDRRLAVIAPIFQQYFRSIHHTAKADGLEPDIRRATLPGNPIRLMGVDINGNDLDLASLRGKVILLHFWGTWCAHCKAEFPNFMALYEQYRNSGLEIIGINTGTGGDTQRRVQQFLETTLIRGKTIPWTILHEGLGERKNGMTMTKYYGINELPVLILIGRDGNVLRLHPLPSTLDDLIAEETSPLASLEFTEEERRQIEELRRQRDEEIDRQIRLELSTP